MYLCISLLHILHLMLKNLTLLYSCNHLLVFGDYDLRGQTSTLEACLLPPRVDFYEDLSATLSRKKKQYLFLIPSFLLHKIHTNCKCNKPTHCYYMYTAS